MFAGRNPPGINILDRLENHKKFLPVEILVLICPKNHKNVFTRCFGRVESLCTLGEV